MIERIKALLHREHWFTVEDFTRKVGRQPCVDCLRDNEGEEIAVFCEYDIDAWFDAVVA